MMTPEEHRLYHEHRYTLAAGLVLLDLILLPWFVYAYDSIEGAKIPLLAGLVPAILGAFDWFQSLSAPEKCSCRFKL